MTPLRHLFSACSWPHLRRRKLRGLLTVISITLAVGLFVSMRVSEHSLLASFQRSTEILSGTADVTVTHGLGIERAALARIETLPQVRAAPVIQESVLAPEINERILILGIDFTRDAKLRDYKVELTTRRPMRVLLPRRIIIGRAFAERHHLDAGDEVKLQTSQGIQEFEIVGLLDDADDLSELAMPIAVMFVHRAQSAFGRGDRYDRIEVALRGTPLEELRATLGPDYLIEPVRKTNPALAYQLQQFRILLHVVTWLALLTSLFLIYNSLYLSVVERKHDLGVFRAVGASRGQIVGLIVVEALVFGIVGTLCGLGLGIVGAQWLLVAMSQFANLLIQIVNVRQLSIPSDIFAWSALIGCGAALLGAGLPAWLAAKVEPLEALSPGATPDAAVLYPRWPALAGSACLLAAFALGLFANVTTSFGISSLLLGCCGMALVVPRILLGLGRRLRARADSRWTVTQQLALDNIACFPARAGLTVVAFAASLAIVIAISGCMRGLEQQVTTWLRYVMADDLTVQLHDPMMGAYSTMSFPAEAMEVLQQDRRVTRMTGIRTVFLPYRDDWLLLTCYDVHADRSLRPLVTAGSSNPSAWQAALRQGEVFVSSNFALLQSWRVGDKIELTTPQGPRAFPIAGIVEDYMWPRGTVFMDRAVYRQLWHDDNLNYLQLAITAEAPLTQVQVELETALRKQHQLFVFRTAEVFDYGTKLLREWFRLADSQIVLALMIGGIGVANTVLISLVTRTRQIGLLAAIGATPAQIYRALAWEAVTLGVLSSLFGIALGLWTLWGPVVGIVEAESGFGLIRIVPWHAIGAVLGGGVVMGILASILPILAARRMNLVAAIGYE